MHLFYDVALSMISSTGILTIDLAAIQSNWLYVADALRMGSECAAAVKADAYGVGAIEVVKALYAVGCKSFYVVTLHEAIELRNALPKDISIYVLGGIPVGMKAIFIDQNLIPVLYTRAAVDEWLSFCELHQRAFPCVLKINTGMTRLGLDNAELDQLLRVAVNTPLLNPVLLMSHLACADEPEHPLNGEQLQRFSSAVAKTKVIFPGIKASLANSSGTFLGDAYHFDMVRIGAALYGINPQAAFPNPLKSVINLKLPVLQIRLAERPEFVGYGATAAIAGGTRLAVVAGGYADGVHRSLGLAPKGQIDGVDVKAIGRLSMDSFVFDISHIDGDPDYIEVINNELSVDGLIRSHNTLGYEVLTSLGRRYRRHYMSACLGNSTGAGHE